jgi:hypothetical protein
MTQWIYSQYTPINVGSNPDDGSGDSIRAAFQKVDLNFANVSLFLSNVNPITGNSIVTANIINGNSVVTTTISGTAATFNNIVANTATISGITNLGIVTTSGNINVGAPLVPTVAGIDIGSAAQPFGNLYVTTTVSTSQVTQSTDAGLLLIHANIQVSDVQDIGIFANVSNDYSNIPHYAFFGHQFTSNNFVYKITTTDATLGNSVIYNGVYGNAQFGSQFLSNTTVSTNATTGALIVAGGAGINGNLYVGGNIYSNSSQVLTLGSKGIGNIWNGYGSLFVGNTVFAASTPSTTTSTGAVVISSGGLGVGGNINVGGNIAAMAFNGPYYGAIQTAAQPNITSLGSLPYLSVGSASIGSLGVSSLTVTGVATFPGGVTTPTLNASAGVNTNTLNVSGGAIIGTTLNVTGEVIAGSVTATVGVGSGQLQAVGGGGSAWYNTMIRNDGANCYLLSSNVATTQGGATNAVWNTHRPFNWNLSTGAVVIAGSGEGTLIGGILTVAGIANVPNIVSTNGGSGGSSAVTIINSNSFGGAGNAGMVTLTNSGHGSKFIRLNSSAGLEVVNSAYTSVIFGISDNGTVTTNGGIDKLSTATGSVGVAASVAPAAGQVLTATSATTATWQSPVVNQVLVDASPVTWNGASGSSAVLTIIYAGTTIANPINMVIGTYVLTLIQDATGSRTVTWGTAWKFPGGVKPVLSTAANAVDLLTFFCDGAGVMYGSYLRGMA